MKKFTLSIGFCLLAIALFSCNNEGGGETPAEDTAIVKPLDNPPCEDCNDTLCQNEQVDLHRIDSTRLDSMALKDAGGVRFPPKVYTSQELQALIDNVDCMNKVLVCSDPGTAPTSNNNINLRIDDRKEDLVEVFYTITLFKGLLAMSPSKFYFYNAYDHIKQRPDIVFEVIGENNTIVYFGDLSGTYPPSPSK